MRDLAVCSECSAPLVLSRGPLPVHECPRCEARRAERVGRRTFLDGRADGTEKDPPHAE